MELNNLSQQKNSSFGPRNNSGKSNKFKELLKNKKSLYGIIAIVLLIAVSGTVFALSKSSKNDNGNTGETSSDTPKSTKATDKPKPTTIESPINGTVMQIKDFDAIKTRPVAAVMIQNNSASRPEYGLNKADVVYESIAESDITRFMAIYWSEGDAGQVRSIRSARKYFVDLLGGYNNPVYMHEGYASGAPEVSAIDAIYNYGVRSLGLQGTALMRDRECELYRNTEHCAYTTTDTIWDLAKQNEWTGDATKIQAWKFKDTGAKSSFNGGDLKDFTVHFSPGESLEYSVNWKYDETTKKYMRFNLDGTPYTTDGDTEQVSKDVVVYQKVAKIYANDQEGHWIQGIIDEGTGYVMQDGKVYNIKWKKPNYETRTKYYDATTGEEFVFNRGKIWVSLVDSALDFVNNTPAVTPTTPAR